MPTPFLPIGSLEDRNMKISSNNNVFRLPGSGGIASKRNEGDGGSGRNAYDPNQTKQDSKSGQEHEKRQESLEDQPDRKQVDEAVAAFQADATTQAHGLSAVVEGAGPGLKIALKDCNGTTVRQFTGNEFLKLRDATAPSASKDARPRGKILDQKF
jgi:hypothetical protein